VEVVGGVEVRTKWRWPEEASGFLMDVDALMHRSTKPDSAGCAAGAGAADALLELGKTLQLKKSTYVIYMLLQLHVNAAWN